MFLVYEIVWLIAAPFVVLSVVLRRGRPRSWGLGERCGFLSPELVHEETAGTRPVWVHAASLGEAKVAAAVIQAVTKRYPERSVIFSAMTTTGRRLAEQAVRGRAFYLPLDLAMIMRRVMRQLRPSLLILVETELWPNLIRAAAGAGVPIVLISGRISPGSYRWARLARPFFAKILDQVTLFLMQSEQDAARVMALGAEPGRVKVCGDMKAADIPIIPPAELTEALIGHPLVVAGSVHAGEVQTILDAYRMILTRGLDRSRDRGAEIRLLLAPRYLEEVAQIEQACRTAGYRVVRRTSLAVRATSITHRADHAIVLLDTHGELAGVYTLATVVFVGGTFVPVGGHNLLEPAAAGRPVLFGPYQEHVQQAARALVAAGGGVSVHDAGELAEQIEGLLHDAGRRKTMGEQARSVVEAQQGALDRTLAFLAPYLTSC